MDILNLVCNDETNRSPTVSSRSLSSRATTPTSLYRAPAPYFSSLPVPNLQLNPHLNATLLQNNLPSPISKPVPSSLPVPHRKKLPTSMPTALPKTLTNPFPSALSSASSPSSLTHSTGLPRTTTLSTIPAGSIPPVLPPVADLSPQLKYPSHQGQSSQQTHPVVLPRAHHTLKTELELATTRNPQLTAISPALCPSIPSHTQMADVHALSATVASGNSGTAQATSRPVGTQPPQATQQRVECGLCGKSFSGISSHNRHVSRTHHKVRPFSCTDCGLQFGQKGSLDRHTAAVHLKSRPYSCDFCGKGFGRRDNMKIHMTTVHLKKKPFKCDMCPKSFGGKRPLKIHRQTVHFKQRPLQCTWCDKRFGQRSNLNVHIKVHQRRASASPSPVSSRDDSTQPAVAGAPQMSAVDAAEASSIPLHVADLLQPPFHRVQPIATSPI